MPKCCKECPNFRRCNSYYNAFDCEFHKNKINYLKKLIIFIKGGK